MTQRKKRSGITEYPEEIRTPADRGQALRAWMDHQTPKMTLDRLTEATKLSRLTLQRYINGDVDIAMIPQESVEKLLTGMAMSDTEGWRMFNIPRERQLQWRTFRNPPMGHGRRKQKTETLELDFDLKGVVSAPEGWLLTLIPGGVEGVQLYRKGNEFFTSPVALAGDWQHIGTVISVSAPV